MKEKTPWGGGGGGGGGGRTPHREGETINIVYPMMFGVDHMRPLYFFFISMDIIDLMAMFCFTTIGGLGL